MTHPENMPLPPEDEALVAAFTAALEAGAGAAEAADAGVRGLYGARMPDGSRIQSSVSVVAWVDPGGILRISVYGVGYAAVHEGLGLLEAGKTILAHFFTTQL